MIITVDGPAAAGKGTLSQKLAEKYCLAYFDTGMVNRAVGLQMMQNGYDLEAATAAAEEAAEEAVVEEAEPPQAVIPTASARAAATTATFLSFIV